MSYGVKYRCIHKAQTNNIETTFRIDIAESGYSGVITEVLGYGDVFNLSYDNIQPTEPLREPIQKGRLDFNILVQGSTEQDLLTDIFEAGEGTYQMALYRDDTLVWKGYVLNDLLEISQADYPFEAKISAKDFTRLEQFEFPLSSIRRKVITTIGDLLNDLDLGLGFKVYPNWTHEEISGDILGNIYLDERQLRDFGEIGEGAEFDEDDRPLTHTQCLELILKSFGMIIRQSEGYYRLFHLSALTDTSTTEYTYDSTTTLISTQTVNLVKSVDKSSRFILPSSQTNFNAGLKRASATLVHNTAQSEIKFEKNINILGPPETRTFTQFFNSNGKQTIRFKTKIEASNRSSGERAGTPRFAPIKIFIDGPTDYYLRTDGSWTTDETTMEVLLTSSRSVQTGFEDSERLYYVNFEVESQTIPVSADGTLTIELSSAKYGSDAENFEFTQYSTPEFEIISEEDAENSVNLAYELVSDADFSKSYNHGTIAFGDGPTPYSPSALYYGTADGERTDGGWSFVGSVDKKGMQRLLLEEIMNMQSQATRNLRAELYGNFNPHELISYESRQYMFLGGSLNGNNVWSADFLQLNFAEPTVTFQELADAKKGGGFTGASSGTVESFWSLIKQSQFFNTIFLSNYVGELSVPISAKSTITSFTADLFAEITEGEDFIIVDKENERPFFVNVVGEYNTGEDVKVTIEEQFISNDLPVGSPIILSSGLLQSYFRIDPNKLLISVQTRDESFYYGKINESYSGGATKTSLVLANDDISATNQAVFNDGQVLRLRREDGENQLVTVNGEQTFTSSPYTLQVDSFETDFLVFSADVAQFAKYKGYIEPVNQGSSIEFLKGQLVLSADGSGGLAQIRLDGTGASSSITLDADNINVVGQTTFTSGLVSEGLETQSGAQSKANTAQSLAQAYADGLVEGLTVDELAIKNEMAQALGFADFASIIASAVQNSTLIVGGFIDTTLINTDAIFANNLVISSTGSIQSSVFSSGSDGFKINADGSAEFNNVAVRSSNFSSLNSGFELTGSGIQFSEDLTIGSTGGVNTFTIQNPNLATSSLSGSNLAFKHVPLTGNAVAEYRSQSLFLRHVDWNTLDGSNNEVSTAFVFGQFNTGGANPTTGITASGSGDFTFDVEGDIECTTLTETSDKYQKENIEPLGATLDKIIQLEGKTFDMLGASTVRKMGLLAQDVEPLFPEAVGVGRGENQEGERIEYKTLSYTQLIPALIESIKELKQEIDQLKNEQGI